MTIRVATAALSNRIFAGRPLRSGKGFKEPCFDVTSDVLKAMEHFIGIGNEVTVECDGKPMFRIAVLPAQGIEARSDETPTAARPVGREPGPDRDAPTTSRIQHTRERNAI